MLDTRVSDRCCTCYMTSSGGQVWQHRCRWQPATVSNVSSMKALMPSVWPIIVTAPLELLHIDFTSIETMMELDQPPKGGEPFGLLQPLYKTHYGICDPPIQLWKLLLGYISLPVSRIYLDLQSTSKAPEQLRNQLWKQHHQRSLQAYGIWKARTSLYQAQTNGQVGQAHQTLMCMIGKLNRDQKADWLRHYLNWCMHTTLWDQPSLDTGCIIWCLGADHAYPLTFISPWKGAQKHQCVDHYVAELYEQL